MFYSNAQGQFSLNGVVGVTASQIRGDDLAGYDKLGITGGLRLSTILKNKADINIELLYSQRGSQSELSRDNALPQVKVNLDYVEIPVYVSLVDWYIEEDDYYRVQVHGGLSYGRLINSSSIDEVNGSLDLLAEAFNKSDFSYLLGATYFASPSLGITARYTRSINNLYDMDPTLFAKNLKGFFLSFRLEYVF
jgi:hypothetical protein